MHFYLKEYLFGNIKTNIENLIECSLGTRIYRAETAALIALALFQ